MLSKKSELWLGIGLNGLIFLCAVLFAIGAIYYNSMTKSFATMQSEYCYTITCPCDTPDPNTNAPVKPCNGYAIKNEGDNFRCSFAPGLLVDKDGTPVK